MIFGVLFVLHPTKIIAVPGVRMPEQDVFTVLGV